MKKVLAFLLVLGIANLASAAMVSLVPTEGSAAPTGNPNEYAAIGDVVTIQVSSDTALLSLDAIVSGAPITGAANLLGDPSFTKDPAIGDNDVLLIVGNFNGIEGALAEVTVDAPSAPITLSIANDLSEGGSLVLSDFSTPEFGPEITIIPEPMTLSLLGLGGLALIRRRRA